VRRISPLTIVLKLFTVANNSKLQKPQYSAVTQFKKLNYASQSKPPTTILDIMSQALHAQYCIDCSAIERRVVKLTSSRGGRGRQVQDNGRPFIAMDMQLPK
jgi:hypothetical protein